jgi:hypothetical protein
MGSFRVAAVLGAALLVTVAGCSTREQGAPVAAGTTSTSTKMSVPSTGKTTATPTKPSMTRPKTIDLKGTDGCKIMSQVQAEFGWQGAKLAPKPALAFPGMTQCIVLADNPSAGTITTVTNKDAEEFIHGGQSDEVQRITIAGFPAFTITPGSSVTAACFTGVNVADSQMLYIQWDYISTGQKPPVQEMCANATRLATAAMRVLGAS